MRVWLLIGAVMLASGADPRTTQERKKSDDDKPVITVTGCVDGSWLRVSKADPSGSYTERYKLRGSKQMMKELAASFKGHLIEVTGAVTDTPNTTHRGKTVQVGKKTTIYTGAKDVPVIPSGEAPSLDVVSYRDLRPSCS